MSSNDFVKGACQSCGGHIEFPASAIGATVPCPHCGQQTHLRLTPTPVEQSPAKPKRSPAVLVVIIAIVILGAAGAGFLIMRQKNQGVAPAPLPAPASATSSPPTVATAPPSEIRTNDFAIPPFKLEKITNSSLEYVVGTVRNPTDRRRFGVKITFGLLDTNDAPVGTASDYHQVLEPNAEWHFKAMVMASKTSSAQLNSILEDQ